MHCHRCGTGMSRIRRAESDHSVQEWYDCPLCGLARFKSEPVDQVLRAWLQARGGGRLTLPYRVR